MVSWQVQCYPGDLAFLPDNEKAGNGLCVEFWWFTYHVLVWLYRQVSKATFWPQYKVKISYSLVVFVSLLGQHFALRLGHFCQCHCLLHADHNMICFSDVFLLLSQRQMTGLVQHSFILLIYWRWDDSLFSSEAVPKQRSTGSLARALKNMYPVA